MHVTSLAPFLLQVSQCSFFSFIKVLPLLESTLHKPSVTFRTKTGFYNKHPLYNTGNSDQHHVTAWMGGGFGENGYMYMYN